MNVFVYENVNEYVYEYVFVYMYIYAHIFPTCRILMKCECECPNGPSTFKEIRCIGFPFMDSSQILVAGISWTCGWIAEKFTPSVESPPCKCECACIQKGSDHGGTQSTWIIWSCLVAVLLVVAANAAIALKVTVTSKGEVREVGFTVTKGKSKGVYNLNQGFAITGQMAISIGDVCYMDDGEVPPCVHT